MFDIHDPKFSLFQSNEPLFIKNKFPALTPIYKYPHLINNVLREIQRNENEIDILRMFTRIKIDFYKRKFDNEGRRLPWDEPDTEYCTSR